MNRVRILLFATLLLISCASPMSLAASECVLLLHGLARTSDSMTGMQKTLKSEGFETHNINYPSRSEPIETLAQDAITPIVSQCENRTVHFVTHSMGGILVREYLAGLGDQNPPAFTIGRVVMLGPPNQGSEVVDTIGKFKAFEWINGPAGLQLGTTGKPVALGAVNFELGVIAGNRSFNPILSNVLPGPDDGKVSVERTHVEGEKEHMVLPVTHTFMMNNKSVQRAVVSFLKRGSFREDATHNITTEP